MAKSIESQPGPGDTAPEKAPLEKLERVTSAPQEIPTSRDAEEGRKIELREIKGLEQRIDELYQDKAADNTFLARGFENAPEAEKNEMRRLTGLSESELTDFTNALREGDMDTVKAIQKKMRPAREIDFAHQDELSGQMLDEKGNPINKDWEPPTERKKIFEN